jgi:hypothetical protein
MQARLASAAADPAAFTQVIASVRGILQATGHAATPLALMEMNVAYDATACVLDASPATVGGALWLADSLGTAIDLGVWTSAVCDISDNDDYALGLIGAPPAHIPRPVYYADALFALWYCTLPGWRSYGQLARRTGADVSPRFRALALRSQRRARFSAVSNLFFVAVFFELVK